MGLWVSNRLFGGALTSCNYKLALPASTGDAKKLQSKVSWTMECSVPCT